MSDVGRDTACRVPTGILKKILALSLVVPFAGFLFLTFLLGPLADAVIGDMAEKVRKPSGDGVLLARNGEILRLFPDETGDFSLSKMVGTDSKTLEEAFLAAEDRRFFEHPGYDLAAIFRSAWLNLKRRKVVSGASTITMQLIRMTEGGRRTLATKLWELLAAVRLERQMSKKEILKAYLARVPMGGNWRGVGLPAKILFGKEPRELSISESALLASIPKSPSKLGISSRADLKRLLARRNWIISRMAAMGFIKKEEAVQAKRAVLPSRANSFPFLAPHFVDLVVARNGKPRDVVKTALDPGIQSTLEKVLASHRARLANAGAFQAAGMVIHVKTMEVLGMVGSFEYGATSLGFNNGCQAARSGGSILKPFLYALALENGLNAASMIPDTRQSFRTPQGDYLPYNADRRTYGPVTVRSALGNSLNISAVKMLNYLGIEPFFHFLVELGLLAHERLAVDRFGLGLAIGNPELRMTDLAAAYGAFAHGGRKVSLSFSSGRLERGPEVFSAETAFVVLDILSDPSARLLTFGNPRFFKFPFPVALKTGTSTNYRDCWLVGLTPEFLILLWAGNFDGSPTFGLAGATACGPVFQDLLTELELKSTGAWFPRPTGIMEQAVCGISGGSPTPYCQTVSQELFIRGHENLTQCSFHTKPGMQHELSAEYADWIVQRREKHLPDPFRLAGALEVVDPLSVIRDLPFSKPGVRIMQPSPASFPGVASGVIPLDNGFASGPKKLQVGGEADEMVVPSGKLSIVSPHHRDHLVMVPGGENYIKLRAIPEEPIPEIIWLIDGNEVARTPPPYEAFWEMIKGEHFVTAVGPGDDAVQIQITVE